MHNATKENSLPSIPGTNAWDVPMPDPFLFSDDPRSPPIGCTEAEMDALLHAMADAAGKSSQESADDHSSQLVEAVRLSRKLNATDGNGMTCYERLLYMGEDLVDVAEMERTYDMRFSVGHGHNVHDDENYKRPIESVIMQSTKDWLIDMDRTLTSLPGLHENETSMRVTEDVERVKRWAVQELGSLMCDFNSTREHMYGKAVEIRDQLVASSVAAHKVSVEYRIKGVVALSKLCTTVGKDGNLSETLQENYAHIRDICTRPPAALLEQMHLYGLTMSVLQACFRSSTSRIGASNLEPSVGRVLDMIQEYLKDAALNENFMKACVACVEDMRSETKQECMSRCWTGIRICDKSEALGVAAHMDVDSVSILRGPTHIVRDTGLYVVSTNRNGRALRVVRLVALVAECVRIGVLDTGKIRASILLSSVARSRSDKRFLADRMAMYVECHRSSHPYNKGHRRPTAYRRMVAPAIKHDLHGTEDEGVPVELQMDYHVVAALRRVFTNGRTPLSRVVDVLTSSGGYLKKHSPRSVQQVVTQIVRKCVCIYDRTVHAGGVVHMHRSEGGASGIKSHLEVDDVGFLYMTDTLSSILRCMDSPTSEWLKNSWRVSRSTKCRKTKSALQVSSQF